MAKKELRKQDPAKTKSRAGPTKPKKIKPEDDLVGKAIDETRDKGIDDPAARTAWVLALGRNHKLMRDEAADEEAEWTRQTAKIRKEMMRGQHGAAWAAQRRQKVDILPTAYMLERKQADGTTKLCQISERQEVLEHIRDEVQKIAEPPEGGYLTEPSRAEARAKKEKVRSFKREAHGDENWEPSYDDVNVMMDYFALAQSKRTSEGPDKLAAELFLYAHEGMVRHSSQY